MGRLDRRTGEGGVCAVRGGGSACTHEGTPATIPSFPPPPAPNTHLVVGRVLRFHSSEQTLERRHTEHGILLDVDARLRLPDALKMRPKGAQLDIPQQRNAHWRR